MKRKKLALTSTTIGKKAVMAVSGVILMGFVIGHLLGNLQAFPFMGGKEALNKYAAFLHSMPGALWTARLVLLGAAAAHIASAVALVKQNIKARPQKYRVTHYAVTTYAARTMRVGGIIVFFFIVFHLAHLTLGVVGPDASNPDVYARLVAGFQSPAISGIYILANAALGLHLRHGVWSALQTLGINHPKYNAHRKHLATAVALLVAGGNISIPVAVMAGIIN